MLSEVKIHNFLVLADVKNISVAARQLHITQQALSKQINQLEQDLDCALFVRTSRGLVLTEAGEIMARTFRSVEASLEHARTEINNNARATGRVLNIGCAAGMRPGPFFNPLCRRYLEQVQTEVWFGQPDTYTDLISWLAEDKFDLALCTDDYGTEFSELESISLCRTPLYFFVAKSHPLASGGASLASFRDLAFYLTDNEERSNRILSICADNRFYPEKLYRSANPYSTYLMVEWGGAVAFGTGFSSLHANPAVKAYRIPDQEVRLQCMWHPEMAGEIAAGFVEFLRSSCDPDQWYYPNQHA